MDHGSHSDYTSYPTSKALFEANQGSAWTGIPLSLASVEDEPGLLALVLHPDAERYTGDLPRCVLVQKEELVRLAKSILKIAPPIEEEILQELRALRAAIESSQQQS